MSPRDIEALESGMLMWLPSTDMAGRQVVQVSFWLAALENWENHERANYYTMMTGMSNQTKHSRKLGFVYICDNTDTAPSRQILLNITRWADMYMSFPGIIRSMHFNLKSSYLLDQVKGYLNWFMRNGITKEARLRSRIHLGNHTENHYSWMSYGIPEKLLMTDLEGNLRIDYVNIWIEKQRERERRQQRQHPPQREAHLSNPNEAMNENLIDYDHEEEEEEEEIMPTNKDVLFGRGVPVQTHVGNAKLIELIHGKYAEYTQLTKRDKH